VLIANSAEDLEAIEVRHHHIEENGVEGLLRDQFECALAAIRLRDREAAPLEAPRQNGAVIRKVIDDQKPRRLRGSALLRA
jgi:hypothetical protein